MASSSPPTTIITTIYRVCCCVIGIFWLQVRERSTRTDLNKKGHDQLMEPKVQGYSHGYIQELRQCHRDSLSPPCPPISFLGGLAFRQSLSHSSSKLPFSQLPIHKGRRAPDPRVSGKALSPSSHQLSVDVVPILEPQCE